MRWGHLKRNMEIRLSVWITTHGLQFKTSSAALFFMDTSSGRDTADAVYFTYLSLTVLIRQVDEVLEGLQPNMSGHFESLVFPFFFFSVKTEYVIRWMEFLEFKSNTFNLKVTVWQEIKIYHHEFAQILQRHIHIHALCWTQICFTQCLPLSKKLASQQNNTKSLDVMPQRSSNQSVCVLWGMGSWFI